MFNSHMEFPAGNKVWPCDYKGTFYLVKCKGNVFASTSYADRLEGRGCVYRHQSVGWTRTFPLLYCSCRKVPYYLPSSSNPEHKSLIIFPLICFSRCFGDAAVLHAHPLCQVPVQEFYPPVDLFLLGICTRRVLVPFSLYSVHYTCCIYNVGFKRLLI